MPSRPWPSSHHADGGGAGDRWPRRAASIAAAAALVVTALGSSAGAGGSPLGERTGPSSPGHAHGLRLLLAAATRTRGAPSAVAPSSGAVVGAAATPDGKGYWLVSSAGAVTAYGDARQLRPHNRRVAHVAGIAATPQGQGYWLVSPTGTVTAYGDARQLRPHNRRLAHVAGIAATPQGQGYWLVSPTGTVTAYGDARPFVDRLPPGAGPVVGATTLHTSQCRLVTADGDVSPPLRRPGGPPPPPMSQGLRLGAVGASDSSYSTLGRSGFKAVVIGASWAAIEPSEGTFSLAAVADLQSTIDAARQSGLDPSLDIGIQYAPQWVFSLGGGTRFVDQYGDTFTGPPSSGNDVPNAVTDGAVRAQLAVYLEFLGSHLRGLASVRVGGGPYNELRYPDGYAGSAPGAFWFYDASSQASLPASIRGWKPGSGTASQAAAFLNAYNSALANFGVWLVDQAERDFAQTTMIELLLPGWGERPGEAQAAAADLLLGAPEEIDEGLDWALLLPALPADRRVVAYTTYADATQGNTNNPDPAAYLHGFLPAGVLEGGESTGNGQTTSAGEALMFSDAKRWHWYAVYWMFSGQPETAQQVGASFSG